MRSSRIQCRVLSTPAALFMPVAQMGAPTMPEQETCGYSTLHVAGLKNWVYRLIMHRKRRGISINHFQGFVWVSEAPQRSSAAKPGTLKEGVVSGHMTVYPIWVDIFEYPQEKTNFYRHYIVLWDKNGIQKQFIEYITDGSLCCWARWLFWTWSKHDLSWWGILGYVCVQREAGETVLCTDMESR